ncbi:hypothetical protein L2E82_47702 [Cichorium intybus]|uniref:Uncharacterized protein n=1 Tax=Cichorium intybus TaxID=13427 RepID=A0ACB8YWA6_CICIN|nr:hypothetical protein L2E82_47702 [Cichorium intybus]
MTSAMDNPVYEEAMIVEVESPAEANNGTFNFAILYLFECIRQTIGLLEPLARLWINYYQQTFGEEAGIILPSPLSFVITSLCTFVQIKAQGSEFPFQTHPRSIKVVVTSIHFYGLVSMAEHFISSSSVGPASVYAIIARLGRMGGLCILVVSLASLFYL